MEAGWARVTVARKSTASWATCMSLSLTRAGRSASTARTSGRRGPGPWLWASAARAASVASRSARWFLRRKEARDGQRFGQDGLQADLQWDHGHSVSALTAEPCDLVPQAVQEEQERRLQVVPSRSPRWPHKVAHAGDGPLLHLLVQVSGPKPDRVALDLSPT